LESGPAAGVIGTQALCRTLGLDGAIAFDMGGTTAKAGVIHKGDALTTGTALVGSYDRGLPVQIAMMDIFEVGTGGGASARGGDAPGRGCWDLGGAERRVTDANRLLGRLGADRSLGGERRLALRGGERGVRHKVAEPLGMDAVKAADGILRIAVTAMSYAV